MITTRITIMSFNMINLHPVTKRNQQNRDDRQQRKKMFQRHTYTSSHSFGRPKNGRPKRRNVTTNKLIKKTTNNSE